VEQDNGQSFASGANEQTWRGRETSPDGPDMLLRRPLTLVTHTRPLCRSLWPLTLVTHTRPQAATSVRSSHKSQRNNKLRANRGAEGGRKGEEGSRRRLCEQHSRHVRSRAPERKNGVLSVHGLSDDALLLFSLLSLAWFSIANRNVSKNHPPLA